MPYPALPPETSPVEIVTACQLRSCQSHSFAVAEPSQPPIEPAQVRPETSTPDLSTGAEFTVQTASPSTEQAVARERAVSQIAPEEKPEPPRTEAPHPLEQIAEAQSSLAPIAPSATTPQPTTIAEFRANTAPTQADLLKQASSVTRSEFSPIPLASVSLNQSLTLADQLPVALTVPVEAVAQMVPPVVAVRQPPVLAGEITSTLATPSQSATGSNQTPDLKAISAQEITDALLAQVATKGFPWQGYLADWAVSGLDQAATLQRLAQPPASTRAGTPSQARQRPLHRAGGRSQPIPPLTVTWGRSLRRLPITQAPPVEPSTPGEQPSDVTTDDNTILIRPNDAAPATTSPNTQPTAAPASPSTPPSLPSAPTATDSPVPPGTVGVVELSADRQEYDDQRQIFTAEGNVKMRFQGSLLEADRLQVNLVNRISVAEGQVALTRGNQVLRGSRFEYNFVQGIGTVQKASGELFLSTTDSDLDIPLGTDVTQGTAIARPLSDRIRANQPQTVVGAGGVTVVVGAGRDVNRAPGQQQTVQGQVNRLRFEAEQIDFSPRVYEAKKIQITNDPFSPPELVLRAERAVITRINPNQDEVVATRPRLVFDQRLAIPLISRIVLDRRQRQPALLQVGYDNGERGGLFIFRSFDIVRSPNVNFTLTPEIFIEKIVFNGSGVLNGESYGLRARLGAVLSPTTTLRGSASLRSLAFDDLADSTRASLRLGQRLGTHTLALEASYRDRLFNNSLGFQTVRSSIGAVFFSPPILLGQTGISMSYQLGVQNITADTDRPDLLAPIRDNNRINLTRYQGAIAFNRTFRLWTGQPLPATQTEGLRYTPTPVVPYLALSTGITGVSSLYSNSDTQSNLIGAVGIVGQFGHMSRNFFDYTGFNITYVQLVGRGLSPFLFDRTVDTRILSLGIVQQIYGPFRVGFQTAINLDTNNQISTDYILEYSRRTYGIILRYNPILEIGSLNLRVSDFNWSGGTEPFEGADVTPVEGGIRRD